MNDINLVNYETKTSSSNNYEIFESSSSPESFPNLMGTGILVEYRYVNYATELIDDRNVSIHDISA